MLTAGFRTLDDPVIIVLPADTLGYWRLFLVLAQSKLAGVSESPSVHVPRFGYGEAVTPARANMDHWVH